MKVAALLLSAAVVGTFVGLVLGAADALERRPAPVGVLTPGPTASPEAVAR